MTHEVCQLIIANVIACVAVVTFLFKVNSSWKNEKFKLSVSATLAEIPDNPEVLWIVCENEGKRPIFCVSFMFTTNRFFKNSKRIMLNSQYKIPDSITLPHRLLADNCISQHFTGEFFNLFNENSNLLGNNKWWAKIKLRFFWRVIVETAQGEFEGRLSEKLVNKIISSLLIEEIGRDQELSME
jgi:hypothetical protein